MRVQGRLLPFIGSALGSLGFVLAISALCSHCAVSSYPGQNGVVTNGFSKIDLEVLMEDGLWVYEVSYDNRDGGPGVGAIVTKLYPHARTYTSNVRTNADGTLYRVKSSYNGAAVQMIALPAQNQVILAPDSHVQFLIDYKAPLDEVDDQNIAEADLFSGNKNSAPRHSQAMMVQQTKFALIKAGKMNFTGDISYEISAIELGDKVFTPPKNIVVETNLIQSGVRTNLTSEIRDSMVKFMNYHFPHGYQGGIKIQVNGTRLPLTLPITIRTIDSAVNSQAETGLKIITQEISP